MKKLIVKRLFYVIGVVSLIALIGAIQPAMALEGPTQIPPHGVTFVDSDTGGPNDKEQWGREGGRLYQFTVHQAGEYNQLTWQPLSAGISFDGEINSADETLTYSYMDAEGRAVWVGKTEVFLLGPGDVYDWETVDTEFRLTVTDIDGNPVPYSLPVGGPSFDLTTLTLNSSGQLYFSALLEMRARMPSYASVTPICYDPAGPVQYSSPDPVAGEFYPALNVFDCSHNHPDYDGLVLTQFDYGFFYELPTVDLDLNDHDAHMEALVGGVQGTAGDTNSKVNFIYEEWSGAVTGLNSGQVGIREQVASVESKVDIVNGYFSGLHLRFDLVDQDLRDINKLFGTLPDTNIMLLLFGLDELIPEGTPLPPFSFVEGLSNLYQYIHAIDDKVDDLLLAVGDAGDAELDIQVKDFVSEDVKGRETVTTKRFIVLLTENGNPVDGSITSVAAIVDGEATSMVPIGDFTAASIGQGIYELTVPLADTLDGVKVLFLQASYNGNPGTINGSKLFTVGLQTD